MTLSQEAIDEAVAIVRLYGSVTPGMTFEDGLRIGMECGERARAWVKAHPEATP